VDRKGAETCGYGAPPAPQCGPIAPENGLKSLALLFDIDYQYQNLLD
jgi:hypothetical protein